MYSFFLYKKIQIKTKFKPDEIFLILKEKRFWLEYGSKFLLKNEPVINGWTFSFEYFYHAADAHKKFYPTGTSVYSPLFICKIRGWDDWSLIEITVKNKYFKIIYTIIIVFFLSLIFYAKNLETGVIAFLVFYSILLLNFNRESKFIEDKYKYLFS